MRFATWGALRALGGLATLAALMLFSVSAASGAAGTSTQLYIVQMLDKPVAAYEGGTAGIPATKPAKGTKIDPQDANVTRYASYLDGKHADLARNVNATKVYDYRFAYNGFAAELTSGQVKVLGADPQVISVEKSLMGHVDTSNTPSFMGLTGPNGAWSKLGGVGSAGEDVIIGVVDTGINAVHPSFSDRTGANKNGMGGKLSYRQIPGWHGKCTPGEEFTAASCNQKLIGAQYFYAGFGLENIAERDFLSPRDWNGHGSHTASTAGGNNGIQATGDASSLGAISGMAPRARIAAYKVCWEEEVGDGGCSSADSVAAIDQAVADGVDVINFSISGTRTNYLDAVEVAFLFAADAGVFVAASAGNNGPGNFTVAHPSPWLSSVAAGTHSRRGTGTITLGNGATHTGNSITRAVGPAPLVRSSAVGKAGADAEKVRLCFNEAVLDPAKVDREDRRLRPRRQRPGRQGGGREDRRGHRLDHRQHDSSPKRHYDVRNPARRSDGARGGGDRRPIKAYIDAAPATATARFSDAVVTLDNPAPVVAGFSSRGPSLAGGEDIMKPDFMAPGEDILAAVAPEGHNGRDFDLLSGTSMSSPHVAGFGALLSQAHPDWSPAAMRSALATTADPAGGNLFDVGSGHVNPTKSLDPGLVYDAGFND